MEKVNVNKNANTVTFREVQYEGEFYFDGRRYRKCDDETAEHHALYYEVTFSEDTEVEVV